MKKVIEVSIGGINFTVEDDAYFRLKDYLKRFEATIPDADEAREVMEDVEARVAEIFQNEMKYSNQVVNMKLVETVIDHLGVIETEFDEEAKTSTSGTRYKADNEGYQKGEKRLYRNPDEKMIAGVCTGLAAYFDVDVTIIRILFVAIFFLYGAALITYIVIWIVAPIANTVPQKLAMRGFAPTAENIRRYTYEHK
ncbi:PspC domain-containing protein [Dysgonomonas sp. ZJ709]|uniref:PspC domain-containing protein n=1 Tax=Dysgonomonas sp. ZJ709 TaxID=2709797 RepID=UPI0013EAC3E5|nr:PspC domain-containing protein [Dysgonomonas sp. ZJ709]